MNPTLEKFLKGKYARPICLNCGKSDSNDMETTVCPCGGMIVVCHATDSPTGRSNVEVEISRIRKQISDRDKNDDQLHA